MGNVQGRDKTERGVWKEWQWGVSERSGSIDNGICFHLSLFESFPTPLLSQTWCKTTQLGAGPKRPILMWESYGREREIYPSKAPLITPFSLDTLHTVLEGVAEGGMIELGSACL